MVLNEWIKPQNIITLPLWQDTVSIDQEYCILQKKKKTTKQMLDNIENKLLGRIMFNQMLFTVT